VSFLTGYSFYIRYIWSSSDSEVDSFFMISNVFALERDICINKKRFYIRINKTREKASIRGVLRQLAYGVYFYEIRYSKSCGSYQDFHHRGLLLARKIQHQVLLLVNLKSPLRKFYGRHPDLVDR
jgi:hypothetical protein